MNRWQKAKLTAAANEEDRFRIYANESELDKEKRLRAYRAMWRFLDHQERIIKDAFFDYLRVWDPTYYGNRSYMPVDLVKVRRKGKALIRKLRKAALLIEGKINPNDDE